MKKNDDNKNVISLASGKKRALAKAHKNQGESEASSASSSSSPPSSPSSLASLLEASSQLTLLIRDYAGLVNPDELAGLFSMYARDLAELSLSDLPEGIDKDERLRVLKRFLCEQILVKSPTLERLR